MAQKEHTHRHQHKSESWRRLSLVLILTMLYMFAEVIGAWWTGSLALLGLIDGPGSGETVGDGVSLSPGEGLGDGVSSAAEIAAAWVVITARNSSFADDSIRSIVD